MACYSPLDGYRLKSGAVSIGYEPEGSVAKLLLPCGRCFGCKMEYSERWAIRLEHEAKCHEHCSFITLTYQEVPWHGSLMKPDVQNFLKRFRRRLEPRRIRYFAAGEYGGTGGRPHWHLAIFGWAPDGLKTEEKRTEEPLLIETWKDGFHEVSRFTPGRARYIAGYAVKKVNGRIGRKLEYEVYHPETGEVFERVPECVMMSRRPGLGDEWFRKYRGDLMRGYIVDPGGVKRRLPRYYRERMMHDAAYAEADEERKDEYLRTQDPGELSDERLRARDTVHRARMANYGKERGN